jgi:alkyl hydroperoxide reductase subunit AhpC
MIQINDLAPNFTADTSHGPINFYEFINGHWTVLFSHPKNFTPVCTTELGTLQKLLPEFKKRGVQVIGLSVDNLDNHDQWLNDIQETQGELPEYPLIADNNRQVSLLYGMVRDNAPDTMTVRTVFVIGPDKKVKLRLDYPASAGRNFDEILRVLDSLQITAEHQLATPANWKLGEDLIVTAAVSDEQAQQRFPKSFHKIKPYLRTVAYSELIK